MEQQQSNTSTVQGWYQDNGVFFAATVELPRLAAGHYSPSATGRGLCMQPITERPLEIIVGVEDCPTQALWRTVKHFFASAETYQQIQVPHRRALLLHGAPGGGKTTAADYVCRQARSELDALTLKIGGHNLFTIRMLRKQEPDRPIICVYEDIDGPDDDGDTDDTVLCEVLDGMSSITNMLFLATSNHPEKLSERLQRPGRLDTQLKFDCPSPAWRRQFLSTRLERVDRLDLLEELVEQTADARIAEMNNRLLTRLGMR